MLNARLREVYMELEALQANCLILLQRHRIWVTITDIIPLLDVNIRQYREDWLIGTLYTLLEALQREGRVESRVDLDRLSEGYLQWRAVYGR